MADNGELVPWQDGQPLTQTERLTAQFYAWEQRGRGWQVWDYPVGLEPPFEPFFFHHAPQPIAVLDDARKPTLLSTIAEGIRSWFRPETHPEPVPTVGEPVAGELEPEPVYEAGPLVAIQASIPPTLKVGREVSEQLLLSLSACSRPLSFELIGRRDAIIAQLVCRPDDQSHVCQQLQAHFPDVVLAEETDALVEHWETVEPRETVTVDFGLSNEFMRPLRTFGHFDPDPLTAVAGALTGLETDEIGVFQILFTAARQPWADSVLRAVTDWEGKAFFADAPEMVALAKEKVGRPLFASLIRVAAQSPTYGRGWEVATALGGALAQFARPTSNELIPLANDGYPDADHEEDFLLRQSRRNGMILNSEELVSLVHLPSASVRSPKLVREVKRSKAAPEIATGPGVMLGKNVHAKHTTTVTLTPEQRLQHMHVIGASGTGKSTLLLNLILQDMENGDGLAVFDPHGDLIDQILGYVPEERVEDVILLDPADEEYPVGFNILHAHSALEQNLLASDLVAVFRRLSTSWGDQMTSVLGNAVLAFLESEESGTLADLRRFLIESEFRQQFLKTVRDPEVVYYWQREFPLLSGKPQAPVLTRLDTFLRPKPIRYMVAQRENQLDFGTIMNERKILLAKLAQGLIGEENATLLGSLLVSKFHQLAMSRQELAQAERRPFYVYMDEFQHFVTPSMAAILAGARKYRLGLVLAHQDLRQLSKDQDVLSAVLSNPYTRICFRVGGPDAKKLEDGFALFDSKDLQNLGLGEAICRVERAEYDFNLNTQPLPSVDLAVARERRERVIIRSRETYAVQREKVEALLAQQRSSARPPAAEPPRAQRAQIPSKSAPALVPPAVVQEVQESPAAGRGGAQHQYLQQLIKRWAESHGWRVTIEQPVLDGLGSVDVALKKGDRSVACEISVTSSPEQELANVQKCLTAGFEQVVVISTEHKVLKKVRKVIARTLDDELTARVHFAMPGELFDFLEQLDAETVGTEATVRGYKVKTRYRTVSKEDKATRKKAISQVILKALKRLKGKS